MSQSEQLFFRVPFISSRMDELIEERRVAYHTFVVSGFHPLMFETEPVENLKRSIDEMLEAADCFTGLYFATIGTHNYELNYMTPIEYELAYFIAKYCDRREENGCRFKPKEKECLEEIRRNLTLHYHHDELKQLTFCGSAMEEAKKRIFIFNKQFCDEKAMSPHLLALLLGLQMSGFKHCDFKTKWHLGKAISSNLEKLQAEKAGSKEKLSWYQIEYEGFDFPGLLYTIAETAFRLGLNLEWVNQRIVDQKKCDARMTKKPSLITAFCTKYADTDEHARPEADLTNEFLKKTDEIQPVNIRYEAGDKPEKAGREVRDRQAERRARIQEGLRFVKPAGQTPAGPPKVKPPSRSGNQDKQIYVRVYHLNVPGVLTRITKVLCGGAEDVFRDVLNITCCDMRPLKDTDEKVVSVFESKSIQYGQFERDKYQRTDLELVLDTCFDEDRCARDALFRRLDLALRMIVGVDHVVIGDQPMQRSAKLYDIAKSISA